MTPPPAEPSSYDEIDPFDLPDWLGETEVTWAADRGLATGHRVAGQLTADGQLRAVRPAGRRRRLPRPVAADPVRVRAHQAWRHGEVLIVGTATACSSPCPGSVWTPRPPSRPSPGSRAPSGPRTASYAVRLRVGSDRSPLARLTGHWRDPNGG